MARKRDPNKARPYERLGLYIQQERERQDYSQEELAKLAVMSEGHISRIEAGLSRPEASNLARLADVLHVDYDVLADYAGYRELPKAESETVQLPTATAAILRRLATYPRELLMHAEPYLMQLDRAVHALYTEQTGQDEADPNAENDRDKMAGGDSPMPPAKPPTGRNRRDT